MLGIRFPLFSKIMAWFFLNLLVVVAAGGILFYLRMENRPRQLFAGPIEGVVRAVEAETNNASRTQRDAALESQAAKYSVDFYLFDDRGSQLGGPEIQLPAAVTEEITKPERIGPAMGPIPPDGARPSANPPPPGPSGEIRPPPSVYLTVDSAVPYWYVGRIMLFDPVAGTPIRGRLVVSSNSYTGHGLFLNLTPVILLSLGIFGFSLIFWFPFVRRMTTALSQMKTATREIADERFDIRVDESRTDEIGELGSSINQMAARLDGFVSGQKRFLGDISHELNSPLARMQFALSILEDRVASSDQDHIQDVKEEVELMSKLVAELLTYSKAGLSTQEIRLEPILLWDTVKTVIDRETSSSDTKIEVEIDPQITVLGRPELLSRAVGNIVNNAIKYAADSGQISVAARNNGSHVKLVVSDHGPGVPEADLERIFDPLYRIDTHRSRQSGGSGLGLAIVKSCIEACRGRVSAQNREPHGLAVTISLNKS